MATEEIIITTDKAVKNVDDLTSSIDKSTEASEDHQKTLLDSAKEFRVMGVSIASLSAGFRSSVSAVKASVASLKVFKVALAATGIGLIVVALGSLVTFLKSTQEGTDKLNKIFNVIKFTIDALIKSVSQIGAGFFKLVSGDIKGGLTDIKDAFAGIGDSIQRNLELAEEFSDLQIRIAEQAITLTVQQAAYNQRIAEQREILNDTTKTEQERLIAGEAALKFANDLAIVQQNNLDSQIRALEIGLESSNTFREDLKEIANLQAQRINTETQASRTRLRIQTTLATLQKKQEADRLAGIETQRDAETEAAVNIAIQKQGIAQTLATAELNIERAKNTNISAMDASLAEQFKGSSIGQAFINIKEGITKAIAQGGVFGLLQIPILLAAGIAQIQSMARVITSPPIKFGKGGLLTGPSHAEGGIKYALGGRLIELEGGEAVINKRSTAMFKEVLSSINHAGGGNKFQAGGVIPSGFNTNVPRVETVQVPVLYKDDLDKVNNRVMVQEQRATL